MIFSISFLIQIVCTFPSLVFVTNVSHCWSQGPSFTRQYEKENILWSENFAFLVFCFYFLFFFFSSSVPSRPLWTSPAFLPSASSCFYFFFDFCFLLHLFPIPQLLLCFLYCLSPEVGLFIIWKKYTCHLWPYSLINCNKLVRFLIGDGKSTRFWITNYGCGLYWC
jgi:hypothetical protein